MKKSFILLSTFFYLKIEFLTLIFFLILQKLTKKQQQKVNFIINLATNKTKQTKSSFFFKTVIIIKIVESIYVCLKIKIIIIIPGAK